MPGVRFGGFLIEKGWRLALGEEGGDGEPGWGRDDDDIPMIQPIHLPYQLINPHARRHSHQIRDLKRASPFPPRLARLREPHERDMAPGRGQVVGARIVFVGGGEAERVRWGVSLLRRGGRAATSYGAGWSGLDVARHLGAGHQKIGSVTAIVLRLDSQGLVDLESRGSMRRRSSNEEARLPGGKDLYRERLHVHQRQRLDRHESQRGSGNGFPEGDVLDRGGTHVVGSRGGRRRAHSGGRRASVGGVVARGGVSGVGGVGGAGASLAAAGGAVGGVVAVGHGDGVRGSWEGGIGVWGSWSGRGWCSVVSLAGDRDSCYGWCVAMSSGCRKKEGRKNGCRERYIYHGLAMSNEPWSIR